MLVFLLFYNFCQFINVTYDGRNLPTQNPETDIFSRIGNTSEDYKPEFSDSESLQVEGFFEKIEEEIGLHKRLFENIHVRLQVIKELKNGFYELLKNINKDLQQATKVCQIRNSESKKLLEFAEEQEIRSFELQQLKKKLLIDSKQKSTEVVLDISKISYKKTLKFKQALKAAQLAAVIEEEANEYAHNLEIQNEKFANEIYLCVEILNNHVDKLLNVAEDLLDQEKNIVQNRLMNGISS
ncbi:hypothetical protein EDEG_02791 [Edhazardia aedis USNM 41457]|uniref:Uncharacterized protein n=1 Tax=Edhazardia aedis (strain USNM 41457) TaxID=1003232 RepID=J9DN62_EDHAE|nr:hypothetical protein EDEG_02791 [Edhazardia aedis USNM 41457]|eukprot:EJW02817.1 hypothetical protein EDEG_02791 [Edhazardia aedis USNM 41457]